MRVARSGHDRRERPGRSARRDEAALRVALDVHGVALPELLARAFPAAAKQMDGRLEANLTLSGTGRDWNAIRPTLAGQGRADVRDGVLKDVNVAESVLGGATGVAGLTSLVPPDVRGRYPDVFGTGDTRFEALGGSIRIANQRVTTTTAAWRRATTPSRAAAASASTDGSTSRPRSSRRSASPRTSARA
jgi:uncharacterized protein involved in outer membrane biogenesis